MFPDDGIEVVQCRQCRLGYKRTIPTPEFLSEVIHRQIDRIWMVTCDFSVEKKLISDAMAGRDGFDMIDIGASRGELLASFSALPGRRSALDVAIYPGLGERLQGEFIEGFIDSDELLWSRDPYDLLIAFDIIEHLYRADSAFRNMASMIRQGGSVVIETGDTDSLWVSRFGLHRWYYVCLFEHHIFWNEASLRFAADRHGLKLERLIRKRHKYVRQFSFSMKIKLIIKTVLYRISPSLYHRVSGGGFEVQPASPFVSDHLFAILVRE